VTRLIIVRHAESAFNLQNRIQGHRDSGLTKKGLSQAKRLAERIRHFHIDKIYSSDLGRAYSTTVEITRRLERVKIIRDPKLREILLGDWEGMTPEEVNKLYERGYQKWLKKPSAMVIPNAERVGHFRRRVTDQVRRIARREFGKTVLLVTHGGVITTLLADWLKADFDRVLKGIQIDNTSLTFADVTPANVKLWVINDTDHLAKKDKNDERFIHKRS
jgi:broad specificity phosphatase PhoE